MLQFMGSQRVGHGEQLILTALICMINLKKLYNILRHSRGHLWVEGGE